jgi:hypothetical protein
MMKSILVVVLAIGVIHAMPTGKFNKWISFSQKNIIQF